MSAASIPALTPTSSGHQFVVYADSCSGVPGHLHERNLAAVNRVIQRLDPPPDFICFPGDEIQGLTGDEAKLRDQWRYWLQTEMAWLDRQRTPLYHTTGNHTTYNTMSESVFAEVIDAPRNGPPTQPGLAYYIRRGNLLMVFVHTLWSGRGGEGRLETTWLDRVLSEQNDAEIKFVFGHHPAFPVNGFAGAFQRQINADDARALWNVLQKHEVTAYWCSHILAFDVQVHGGILQIVTAGAGTDHRMPAETEYLHCVQAAVDADELRYQVLDVDGQPRERLTWPLPTPDWEPYKPGAMLPSKEVTLWRFTGRTNQAAVSAPQTLLAAEAEAGQLPSIWIGLTGPEQRLTAYLSHAPERSPHHWYGTTLSRGQPFDLQLALHRGMGPGGLLWRRGATGPWSSMSAASAWGLERLAPVRRWQTGHSIEGDQRFAGDGLSVAWA